MSAFGTPLHELRQELDDRKAQLAVAMLEIKPLQDEIAAIQGEIEKQLFDVAMQSFKNQDKTSGDLTLLTDAGKVKASISKTVKWDSAKLQKIASGMSWAEAQGVFKIDFSVPEANYKAAQNLKPELAEKLLDARSVKYGDLKLAIIE